MADEAGDLSGGQPQAASQQRLIDEASDLRPQSPRGNRCEEPDNTGRVAHNDVLVGAIKKAKIKKTKKWIYRPPAQEQRCCDD